MATIRLYPAEQVIVDRKQPNYRAVPGSTVTLRNSYKYLTSEPLYVCRFGLPESLKWASVVGARLYVYARSITPYNYGVGRDHYHPYLGVSALSQSFDFSTGTYKGIYHARYETATLSWDDTSDTIPSYQSDSISYYGTDHFMELAVKNGVYADFDEYGNNEEHVSDNLTIDTGSGANKPYIELTYDETGLSIDAEKITIPGYFDPAVETKAAWSYKISGYPIFPTEYAEQSIFSLQWTQNKSGTLHDVPATAKGCTIPAGTLPELGTVYTRVKIVDPNGNTTLSDWVETQSYKNIVVRPSDLNPSAGFINEKTANVFTWILNLAHPTTYVKELTLACSYELQWRPQNGSWQTIPASAGRATVPASTFSSANDLIEVRAVVENPAGVREYSAVSTFTTHDSACTAACTYPNNDVVSDAADITFTWQHIIDTGSAPSNSELFIRSKGAGTWTPLATADPGVTSLPISLAGRSGGAYEWSVITTNSDGEQGTRSPAATFTLIAAPNPPIVRADANPFAVISWQSENQQGYEVSVDGQSLGAHFGTVYSERLVRPLSDGPHAAAVRVQNNLGLWSEWANIDFYVTNTPGEPIKLTAGCGDYSSALEWETSGAFTRYLIERDGQIVAETFKTSYVDDFATRGEHEYSIIGELSTGNYSRSNSDTGATFVPCLAFATLKDRNWLPLPLSEKSTPQYSDRKSRVVTYRHFSGSPLPVAEYKDDVDEILTLDFAVPNCAEAAKVEALHGKTIIAKTPRGDRIVAPFASFEKYVGQFYASYRVTLQAVDYTEEERA